MNKLLNVSLAVIALTAIVSSTTEAVELPPASPSAKVEQVVGYSNIKLSYSRPIARGRSIFGELVPYDTLWRTGANGATTLELSDSAKIGGKEIAAGKYSLLSIPGKKSWTVILNSHTDKFWPPAGYDASKDVVRFEVKPEKIKNPVEVFTAEFSDISFDKTSLVLSWEKTAVQFDIEFDTHSKAVAEIEKLLANAAEAKPYEFMQAASYYFRSDRDLNEALVLAERSIDESENVPYWSAFYKAEILEKLGRKKEALKAAEVVLELATKDPNDPWGAKYADWAKKLIERVK